MEQKILQLKAMKHQPVLKEKFERLSREKANVDKQVKELKRQITEKDNKIDDLIRMTDLLKRQITESRQEHIQFNQLYKELKAEKEQLETVLAEKMAELDRVLQDQAETKEGMHQLEIHYNHIQNELLKCEEQLELSRQNEKILSEQIHKMNEELLKANNKTNEFENEINDIKQELEKKIEKLREESEKGRKMGEDLQVFKEIKEQLHKKNVSYQQTINQLEAEKNEALKCRQSS